MSWSPVFCNVPLAGSKAEDCWRELCAGAPVSDSKCQREWKDDRWNGQLGEAARFRNTAGTSADVDRISNDANKTVDGSAAADHQLCLQPKNSSSVPWLPAGLQVARNQEEPCGADVASKELFPSPAERFDGLASGNFYSICAARASAARCSAKHTRRTAARQGNAAVPCGPPRGLPRGLRAPERCAGSAGSLCFSLVAVPDSTPTDAYAVFACGHRLRCGAMPVIVPAAFLLSDPRPSRQAAISRWGRRYRPLQPCAAA